MRIFFLASLVSCGTGDCHVDFVEEKIDTITRKLLDVDLSVDGSCNERAWEGYSEDYTRGRLGIRLQTVVGEEEPKEIDEITVESNSGSVSKKNTQFLETCSATDGCLLQADLVVCKPTTGWRPYCEDDPLVSNGIPLTVTRDPYDLQAELVNEKDVHLTLIENEAPSANTNAKISVCLPGGDWYLPLPPDLASKFDQLRDERRAKHDDKKKEDDEEEIEKINDDIKKIDDEIAKINAYRPNFSSLETCKDSGVKARLPTYASTPPPRPVALINDKAITTSADGSWQGSLEIPQDVDLEPDHLRHYLCLSTVYIHIEGFLLTTYLCEDESSQGED